TIGCTSSSSDVDAVADTCQTPGYSAEKISLGYVHPDQGALGSVVRAARSGVDARIGEANDNGGVHGRTIDYTWRDDRGDPDGNRRAVTELVEIDEVFGVLEATTAASGGAAYLAENHVPVAGIAAEEEWSLHRNMFAPWYSISDGPSVNT
nr:ABC transporter substrate-binding protein [Micromonospora sp. DSM 115978]